MKKLMVLGASMTIVLAACGGANGLEGNTSEMEISNTPAGTFEFGSDGEVTVEETVGTTGESYEVNDDEIIIVVSDPNEEINIEMIFNYEDIDADVIEGELEAFNISESDVPEGFEDSLDQMYQDIEGAPYSLTKVDT